MAEKKLLTKGNHKLCNAVGIWTLPTRITCPGATQLCKEGMTCQVAGGKKTRVVKCYAAKAEIAWKGTLPCRSNHLAFSRTDEFVPAMIAEITKDKLTMVRLHESGDVYSQEYLNKIYAIAKACPGTKFWMYTKSFMMFDWTGVPGNLVIYRSIDRTSPADWAALTHPALIGTPTAYLLCPDEPVPADGTLTCVPGGKTEKYCGDVCKICVNGHASVYFDAH